MSFASSNLTFGGLVNILIGYVNLLVPVLAGMAILYFFYGLIRFIYKAGDAKGRAAGRTAIVWGLIGLFCIFSIWGILKFAQSAVFGGSSGSGGQINDFGDPNAPVHFNPQAMDEVQKQA